MKETLQAGARFFLLSVLILSNCAAALAYYHPEEGRWLSRDPIGEPGFELTSHFPLSQKEKLARDLQFVLNAAQSSMPDVVQSIRRLLLYKGIDLLSSQGQENLYAYVGNRPIEKFDPFGLKANDQCCDKASKDAAKKLIDELISNLLDQAKVMPGRAGEIAKMIGLLNKVRDAGESCTDMKNIADTCADFAKRPQVESCYACCMKIYGSYGSILGGVGHFVCTSIATHFN